MRGINWIWITLLAIVLIGCGKGDEPSQSADKPAESKPEEATGAAVISLTPEALKTAGIVDQPARNLALQTELAVTGVVASTAKGRALVTPPVAGKVISLLVNVGDQVRQGQPLAVIQSSDLAQGTSAITEAQRAESAAEADVRKAKSEHDLALARLRTAKAILARQHQLASTGAFSQPSLQAAQNELNEAEGELLSAKQDEEVHRAQLDRAERLFKQELISRTDLEQARLAVSQDEVRRGRAQKHVDLASATLQREKQIAQKGLLTAREVQAAEAEVRSANLEVQRQKIEMSSAAAALAGARRAVANARSSYSALKGNGNSAGGSMVTLTAPIGGAIAHREASIGQAVERTTELYEIDNLDSVWVTANVPEREIAKVRKGARVTLTTSAYPKRIFVGVIQVVSTRLDPKSRTMPVQCLVQNSDGVLRPDMFAQVNLGVGATSIGLAVPVDAVNGEADDAAVFVRVGEGKFEKRSVQTGRRQGGFIEILSGLKEGDRVVVKGVFTLVSESRKGELQGEE